jgi:hypothetical protein
MAKAEPRSITRRSLVAALALPAVPLLPAVAAALPPPDFASAQSGLPAAPDPVFAAIEAHVRACAELNAFLDELAEAEQAAWHAPRGQRRAANKRLRQAYATERRFGDFESDAAARMVATVPQTLQGAAAMLSYVREHFERGDAICDEENAVALLGSVECAIRKAVGLRAARSAMS